MRSRAGGKPPDGQITSDFRKSKSSHQRKNIPLNTSGKSPLVIRPSRPTRGVAHVTNARWDAMDATASGAQGIAGRIELRERSSGARTNGAEKLSSTKLAGSREVRRELWRGRCGRRNRAGPTPRRWRQVLRRCVRPTGIEIHRQSARRWWQESPVTRVNTYKP